MAFPGELTPAVVSSAPLQRAGRLAVRLLASLGLVAAVTYIFSELIPVNATTAGFFYLVAILIVAAVWGLLESALASVAAMLCFNYFFLPPVGTFTVADPQNWVALFAFLATSLTASQLSDRLKRERMEAVDRQQEMERLYAFSRALLLTDATQPIGKQIAHQVAQTFEFPAVALYDRHSGQTYQAGPRLLPDIDGKLREAALQSTVIQNAGRVNVSPIRLGGEPIGSLAVSGASLSDAALQSLLNLVAVGLERVRAQEAVNRAEVSRQSEELKSTVLDAIAHEFKTPLTSIKAATTDLLDPAKGLQREHRELLTIADEGADRLSGLVTEAIQLARIVGGEFHLNREVRSPASLISAALRQMRPLIEGREVRVLAADDLPLLFVDTELVQVALRNLIDNALKYSPPTAPITITAEAGKEYVTIGVRDQGPGIPEEEQSQIFDKFYRAVKDRSVTKGTGMGLAIAREIVRAHGGEIWLKSMPGAGSEFYFSLPLAPKEKMV
jgi:two-component system sensor histidine kinase KdpD